MDVATLVFEIWNTTAVNSMSTLPGIVSGARKIADNSTALFRKIVYGMLGLWELRPKTSPKSSQNRSKIDQKSTKNRSKIDLGGSWGRSGGVLGPSWGGLGTQEPSRPQKAQKSTPKDPHLEGVLGLCWAQKSRKSHLGRMQKEDQLGSRFFIDFGRFWTSILDDF